MLWLKLIKPARIFKPLLPLDAVVFMTTPFFFFLDGLLGREVLRGRCEFSMIGDARPDQWVSAP